MDNDEKLINKVIRSEWSQIGMVLITVAGLFFWNRTESRSDMRHMDSKLELYRAETNSLIKAIHDEIKDFNQKMYLESKDFHGRLISIETKIMEK